MISRAEAIAARDRASQVEAEALRRLGDSPYPTLRRVSCFFDDGVLTMRGRVASFYLKQLAQTAVVNLRDVERIENCIEVVALTIGVGRDEHSSTCAADAVDRRE